jgi:hypothetical protein
MAPHVAMMLSVNSRASESSSMVMMHVSGSRSERRPAASLDSGP